MSEKQLKKIFLKQIKPFLRRCEAESKRKNASRRLMAKTTHFKAAIDTAGAVPVFAASFHDVIHGANAMRVPILFPLPIGFEKGFQFSDAVDFKNFRLFCEEK